jgi:predicted anti-sigma-YlaC factor YlaD
MLSCKQVATLASQYLDQDTNTGLTWKIRMHLMMCANCRRFMRHLKITRLVAIKMVYQESEVDTEAIWKNVQEKIRQDK